MRHLVLAAALLLLGACGSSTTRTVTRNPTPSPTTAPARTTSSQPVYFAGAAGPAAQRPSSLQLTADGTLSVERVQWTSWGGAQATGSGRVSQAALEPVLRPEA